MGLTVNGDVEVWKKERKEDELYDIGIECLGR